MEDSDLLECCLAHPQGAIGIRRTLAQQQTQGRLYLVTAKCDNIGPLGDCQGHWPRPEVYMRVIDGVLRWTADGPGAEDLLTLLNNWAERFPRV